MYARRRASIRSGVEENAIWNPDDLFIFATPSHAFSVGVSFAGLKFSIFRVAHGITNKRLRRALKHGRRRATVFRQRFFSAGAATLRVYWPYPFARGKRKNKRAGQRNAVATTFVRYVFAEKIRAGLDGKTFAGPGAHDPTHRSFRPCTSAMRASRTRSRGRPLRRTRLPAIWTALYAHLNNRVRVRAPVRVRATRAHRLTTTARPPGQRSA